MDFKKLAVGAAGAALFLSAAVPAFAHGGWWHHHSEDELTIENRNTNVTTTTFTAANTGLNYTGGGFDGGGFDGFGGGGWHHRRAGDIDTGDAVAISDVGVSVNYTEVAGCGCFDDVSVTNGNTNVTTRTVTLANSGLNRTGSGDIDTGDAVAMAYVVAAVNTTVVGE